MGQQLILPLHNVYILEEKNSPMIVIMFSSDNTSWKPPHYRLCGKIHSLHTCSYLNAERARQHSAVCSDFCCCWFSFHFASLGAIDCSAYSVLNPTYFEVGHPYVRDRNPRLNASRDIHPHVISASTSHPVVPHQAWVSSYLCTPLVRCKILFHVPNFPTCVGWQSWRIRTSDPPSVFSGNPRLFCPGDPHPLIFQVCHAQLRLKILPSVVVRWSAHFVHIVCGQ